MQLLYPTTPTIAGKQLKPKQGDKLLEKVLLYVHGVHIQRAQVSHDIMKTCYFQTLTIRPIPHILHI